MEAETMKMLAIGLGVGLGMLGPGLGLGLIGYSALQGIARNPEACVLAAERQGFFRSKLEDSISVLPLRLGRNGIAQRV